MIQTAGIGSLALLVGMTLTRKVSFLQKFCIPSPVSGGIIFSLLTLALYTWFHIEVSFDKTLMDVLIPADEAYSSAAAEGLSFEAALDAMDAAALKGRDSTVDMVAKLGRSSRLGERSRGVMDAGSASCYLILHTMADTIKELLA